MVHLLMLCYSLSCTKLISTQLTLRHLHDISRLFWKMTFGHLKWNSRQGKLRCCEDVIRRHYFKTSIRRLHNVLVAFVNLVTLWYIEIGFTVSQLAHQHPINVETTLMVNFHQRYWAVGSSSTFRGPNLKSAL